VQVSLTSDVADHSDLAKATSITLSHTSNGTPTQASDAAARPGGRLLTPSSPDASALFLDVDGTLLPIASRPDAVAVPPGLLTLLADLERHLQGALALVSGRSIADLDRLFAPLSLPTAGVHGLERRGADGTLHREATAELLDPLRRPIEDFIAARPGLLLEDKRQSLALHYRNAPQLEAEVETLLGELLGDAPSHLSLQRGKMVIEVRAGSADKGTAIEAFSREAPFAGRVPVFIGDDVTDEDGFRLINRLGGLSIRVGEAQDSAAVCILPDEAAVYAWLRAWISNDQRGKAG
jgi:trehalose 6-phosphate phosphatase